MKTKIIKINSSPADKLTIKKAGEIIKNGGLVAFPTETVYGLGGDALNAKSAARIYSAKGRPADNPLIVHICRTGDIDIIAEEIPDIFYILAEKFWPGPLTMILNKSSQVPESTTGGLKTIAVRMPDNQTALSLIDAAGGFIAAPSANLSGRPSPTVIQYVIEDMDGRIEMILDGGDTKIGLESTIIDLTTPQPVILRPGSITAEMLEAVINIRMIINSEASTPEPPKAPGMKYRHYAPRGQMWIVIGDEDAVIPYINHRIEKDKKSGLITGVIATKETCSKYHADRIKCIGNRSNEEDIARNLYRILRELDDEKTDVIYSESFTGKGLGQAIMNRLLKASSYQILDI